MTKLWNSVSFRLALGHGALMICAMAMISWAVYFGTVGVLNRGIDAKLFATSRRLSQQFEISGIERLRRDIDGLLTDGIDQDTEVYLLLDAGGRRMTGNLSGWNAAQMPFERLTDQVATRSELGADHDQPSVSRLLPHRLSNGAVLVVGRDIQDIREIEQLVLRALTVGGGVTLLLAIGGVFLLRRQLEHRVAVIRRTALEIEAGDLSRRIPVSDTPDEFSRLSGDINHMLDRIQHLMDGVRDVSNAIAHDLRTPLGRIRSLLDEALLPGKGAKRLSEAAVAAIGGIDELITVFDKLLQIAEAESGTRRQSFRPVALREVITDVVELYDAAAEAKDISLAVEIDGEPMTLGDKDLLRSATANLIDNALKYAGSGAAVRVRAAQDQSTASIVVEDDGPGIPPEELAKVATRFYRLDRSRSLPGNGLGLPIVAAIGRLHGGTVSLESAHPGLIARIVLPRASVAARSAAAMETASRVRAASNTPV